MDYLIFLSSLAFCVLAIDCLTSSFLMIYYLFEQSKGSKKGKGDNDER